MESIHMAIPVEIEDLTNGEVVITAEMQTKIEATIRGIFEQLPVQVTIDTDLRAVRDETGKITGNREAPVISVSKGATTSSTRLKF